MEPRGGVAFEMERLEVTGGDRLEVAGRWTGVRGVRFVRPSLIVRSGDGERSVLAVLDHKPWAPEEGRSWIAAFPWAGDPVDPESAQLAVAPSIVVPLATAAPLAPARRRRARQRPEDVLREELDAERTRVRRLEAEVAFLREQRELLTARVEEAERAAEAERARQAERAAEAERAGERAGEAERAREPERGDDHAAAADAIAAERRAREEADELARTEREAALLERDAHAAERDALRKALDAARVERDAMRRARDEAFAERDAALVGRDAARAAARTRAPARTAVSPFSSTSSHGPDWVARGLAAAAVVCLLLLLIGLVRVL